MTIRRPEFYIIAGEAIHSLGEEMMGERQVIDHRNYPIEVIRDRLARHAQDLEGIAGLEWLARVVDLCRQEASAVPPPAERVETVPEYIYPH